MRGKCVNIIKLSERKGQQKISQKRLDKERNKWYTNKVARRKSSAATVSWKLNNKRNETLGNTLSISKYEEVKQKTEKDLHAQRIERWAKVLESHEKVALGYNLIKSLILAQDERWRHA